MKAEPNSYQPTYTLRFILLDYTDVDNMFCAIGQLEIASTRCSINKYYTA